MKNNDESMRIIIPEDLLSGLETATAPATNPTIGIKSDTTIINPTTQPGHPDCDDAEDCRGKSGTFPQDSQIPESLFISFPHCGQNILNLLYYYKQTNIILKLLMNNFKV
jgi:hypothetical protein